METLCKPVVLLAERSHPSSSAFSEEFGDHSRRTREEFGNRTCSLREDFRKEVNEVTQNLPADLGRDVVVDKPAVDATTPRAEFQPEPTVTQGEPAWESECELLWNYAAEAGASPAWSGQDYWYPPGEPGEGETFHSLDCLRHSLTRLVLAWTSHGMTTEHVLVMVRELHSIFPLGRQLSPTMEHAPGTYLRQMFESYRVLLRSWDGLRTSKRGTRGERWAHWYPIWQRSLELLRQFLLL